MKYEVKFTNQFKKDLKLAKKQSKDKVEKAGIWRCLAALLFANRFTSSTWTSSPRLTIRKS